MGDIEQQRGENPFDEPTRKLRSRDPGELALKAGVAWEPAGGGEGSLLLPVLGDTFEVAWPEITVSAPPALASFSLKLLALLYLACTDGAPPTGNWVAYRELPGGRFYEPVVKRSVEDPLAEAYADDVSSLGPASAVYAGKPLDLGDAAFSFALFPGVLVALIVWKADEEFPARAQALFDSGSIHHLNAFDLRMGAQEISSRLIRAVREV
jgi:hypothetical protein